MAPIEFFAFGGLTLSGILLLLSVLLKITDGRFWSIPFSAFFDRKTESEIGLMLRRVILKFVPPFFIFFLVFFLYVMLT